MQSRRTGCRIQKSIDDCLDGWVALLRNIGKHKGESSGDLECGSRCVNVLVVRVGIGIATCSVASICTTPIVIEVLCTECIVVHTDWSGVSCNRLVDIDNILVLLGVLDSGSAVEEGPDVSGAVCTPRGVVYLSIACAVVYAAGGVHTHKSDYIILVEDSSPSFIFEGLEEGHIVSEVCSVAQIVEGQVDLPIQTAWGVVDETSNVGTLSLRTSILQVDRNSA